jgi:hypothetical protein
MVLQHARKYTWKLDERGTCVFDSNGSGIITLAPGGARERWEIHFMAVSATQLTPTKVPTMVMYRSSAVPGNQLGGTSSAISDSNTDPILLNMNEPIVFVFTGGDAGASGSIHIEGLRFVWE